MTPAQVKSECEKTWRKAGSANAINMTGWRINTDNQSECKLYSVKAKKHSLLKRKAK